MPAPLKWTEEQIKDMIVAYERGESLTAIAKRYGTSQQVIGPLLKKHGVRLRPRYQAVRMHTCNYMYFHSIDTEEKAYWLGFMAAIGCITTGNRVILTLPLTDREHLMKLKAALEASQPVCMHKSNCSLTICSPEIVEDLAAHGILPKKTRAPRVAELRSDLVRHYWRGVFDGHGRIMNYGLLLVGNADVVLGFQEFIFSLSPQVKASVWRNRHNYRLYTSRQTAFLLVQALYEDATTFLTSNLLLARNLSMSDNGNAVTPRRAGTS